MRLTADYSSGGFTCSDGVPLKYVQSTFPLSASHLTWPPVSRSIFGQYSTGTPRTRQFVTVDRRLMPSSRAILVGPPTRAKAYSRADAGSAGGLRVFMFGTVHDACFAVNYLCFSRLLSTSPVDEESSAFSPIFSGNTLLTSRNQAYRNHILSW